METAVAFSLFLGGLSSPDGLALASDGTVFVVEEATGTVKGINPQGVVFIAMLGLESPEGVAWHPELGVVAVEDIHHGRLVSSVLGVLERGIPNPEGVAVTPDGEIYYTWTLTGGPSGICRWTPEGPDSIVTLPRGFMLSGLTAESDDLLFACNEMPLTGLFSSVVAVSVGTGAWVPYSGGIPSAEGLRFSPDGTLLLVACEELGSVVAVDPGGERTTIASGFESIEDIIFLPDGDLLVTDDGAGSILRVPMQ